MSGEGEGRPAAPNFWRLRLLAGSLFALAAPGLGLAPTAAAASLRSPRGLAESLRTTASGPASVAACAALSALLVALVAPAGKPRATPEPPLPRPPSGPSRPGRGGLPGPGPARELLALFERPRSAALPREPAAQRPAPERPAVASQRDLPLLLLFGPLSFDGRDQAALRQRAVRGLIAYLVLRPGAVSFDELAEALWPGEDLARSRARVHKAKQNAQRLLGDTIRRHGAAYLVDPATLRTDAAEIARLASGGAGREQLERALELAAGEPLADVDYPFAETERRRLRAVRSDLLARVAAARLGDGEARRALDAAEQLIALDRLNELGWRLAMEAEAVLGARQAVVERYGLLEHELDAALGLRPDAETRATYRRLLGQS